MNLKFKGEDGKNRFCHTLNGSGTALARLYVALVETYQQPNGTYCREYTQSLAGKNGPQTAHGIACRKIAI